MIEHRDVPALAMAVALEAVLDRLEELEGDRYRPGIDHEGRTADQLDELVHLAELHHRAPAIPLDDLVDARREVARLLRGVCRARAAQLRGISPRPEPVVIALRAVRACGGRATSRDVALYAKVRGLEAPTAAGWTPVLRRLAEAGRLVRRPPVPGGRRAYVYELAR